MPGMPHAPHPRSTLRRPWMLTVLFAAALLLSFLLQLPTWRVADWGQFAFYDPGTTLKGDMLLAKGYVPTVDFGYTHGLLSLIYGRVGFGVLGRSPGAFLVLTLLLEMGMAWAVARILVAAGIGRKGVWVMLAALPMAVMPAYLTLTHPLEAMLILLGLAAQAEGRRAQALALATVCVFVKPSMGYVYGFVLLMIIVWNVVRHRRVAIGERLGAIVRQVGPAAGVGVGVFVVLSLGFGMGAVVQTLVPTTGAKTYAATGFGFFRESGRAFWWPGNVVDFFITPACVFLLAAAASLVGAVWAGWMLIRRPVISPRQIVSRQRAWEILLTAGVLHTAFLVGFYGWPGSWSYYSYLPSLGLMLVVVLLPVRRDWRRVITLLVIVVLLVSHGSLIGTINQAWRGKSRVAEAGNLWVYPAQFAEWQQALDATQGRKTLVMTNGFVPRLPPAVTMPDAWFPEPGIPTASEVARVKAQVEGTECVIVWWEYRGFDVWNSAELMPLHGGFRAVFTGTWFTVLEPTGEQECQPIAAREVGAV